MVYFYGDYQEMKRVIKEVLVRNMGYLPCCIEGGSLTDKCVRSSDGVVMIETDTQPMKVAIIDESMIDKETGNLLPSAGHHLDVLVEILKPTKIVDALKRSITATLYIR